MRSTDATGNWWRFLCRTFSGSICAIHMDHSRSGRSYHQQNRCGKIFAEQKYSVLSQSWPFWDKFRTNIATWLPVFFLYNIAFPSSRGACPVLVLNCPPFTPLLPPMPKGEPRCQPQLTNPTSPQVRAWQPGCPCQCCLVLMELLKHTARCTCCQCSLWVTHLDAAAFCNHFVDINREIREIAK